MSRDTNKIDSKETRGLNNIENVVLLSFLRAIKDRNMLSIYTRMLNHNSFMKQIMSIFPQKTAIIKQPEFPFSNCKDNDNIIQVLKSINSKRVGGNYGDKYDYVTMEGSGGIICPIRWDEQHLLLEDLIKATGLGTLVISNAALGSINACVLTIFYLQQKGIPVRGIILNNYDGSDFMQADNKKMMEAITGVPVIAEVKPDDAELNIDVEVLKNIYE